MSHTYTTGKVMLHPAWERVARQTLLAAFIIGALAMVIGLYHERRLSHVHTLTLVVPAVAIGIADAIVDGADGAMLQLPTVEDLRVRSPRYWRLQPCGQSQRVHVGGTLLPDGTAVSPAGTCRLQTWCESPLAQTADGQLLCRAEGGHIVVGAAGFETPSRLPSTGAQTGRCATVTAVCSRRTRFELPLVDEPTVLVELWPPPDGSAAVAMFCGPGVFRVPFGHAWTATTAVPAADYALDPGCDVTKLVLSDDVANALASVPRATVADQTYTMADITVVALTDELLVVTVHAVVSDADFCVRWFFWPLAVRGARLAAVGGFSMPDRPLLGSTTCVSLPSAPVGEVLTLLLLADAAPSAMGLQVGVGPAEGPTFAASAHVDSTLPLAYRMVASHALALLVPPRPLPFALYDTTGTLRALVPPDSPRFPSILMDGWRPRCDDCVIVFADDDSAPASLCYTLPEGARIVSPVTMSTRPPILAHMVGQTLRASMAPPAALVGTDDSLPQLVLPQEMAIADSISVTCGMNTYRMPTAPPPSTHCVPTAGVYSVGAISRVWVNSSAELSVSISFPDCALWLFHTDLGFQIAPEPCVPTAPGTTIEYSTVEICAATAVPIDLSAASIEVARQLNLYSPLYALVIN